MRRGAKVEVQYRRRADLDITVADPLRAGDEQRHHPGETNLGMADVVVINEPTPPSRRAVAIVAASVAAANPGY